jgi:fatty-acyl-CoA synthase
MGEAVMAFVIPKAGETLEEGDIAAFARGRIANFKAPKYIEIVESFPLTGSGKVQKFKQRACAVEKLGLKEPD